MDINTQKSHSLLIAALIIGIFGAVAGFMGALLVLTAGGLGTVLEQEGAGLAIWSALIAVGASIMGLVGAAISLHNPKAASRLMLASAVVGFIGVTLAYAVAIILFGVASFLIVRHDPTARFGFRLPRIPAHAFQ